MPMSEAFQNRLFLKLPGIINHFGTPFHIYDEQGIIDSAEQWKAEFKDIAGFKEFFAVKALPNPEILKLMRSLGFGLDCSSTSEVILGRECGFSGEEIILTSNNTGKELFDLATADGGCILNLDDISFIEALPEVPEMICFRYNPGMRRTGTGFIGNPVEAKYGLTDDQVIDAYRIAAEKGAKRFGLHTMIISNERDHMYMVETVRMLLEVMERVTAELGIRFDFFNIGGGVGIPYRPEDNGFDMHGLAVEAKLLLNAFEAKQGYVPKLFMECGRYPTGPHGVLVASVVNRMSKYREYVGVDVATMSANPRPAIYDAYHHIAILGPDGNPKTGKTEVVDVVGPLCENSDKFGKERELPVTVPGDIMIQHDTGAHCYAMAGNYNGWLRPKELLLRTDGSVELIRRAETMEDLFKTLKFEPDVMNF